MQVADAAAGTAKAEPKALQFPVKEFQPRNEPKNATVEESSSVSPVVVMPPVANKDSAAPVPVQLHTANATTETSKTATTESEQPEGAGAAAGVATPAGTGFATTTTIGAVTTSTEAAPTKSVANASSANMIQTPMTPYWANIGQEHAKPSTTAPSANSVPVREPFHNLSAKTSSAAAPSNSPPRRKSNATELPSNTKEQKDRKTREKSLGSSRGTTPTPVYSNQDHHHHHHQKANGDATGDKTEQPEVLPRNEIQQKPSDGKYDTLTIHSQIKSRSKRPT